MNRKIEKRKVKFKIQMPEVNSEHYELIEKALQNKHFEFSKYHKAMVIESIENTSILQKLTLLAIELREGWRQFGCSSMKNFLLTNLGAKYSTLNRRLVAARVENRIGGLKMVGKFNDAPLFQMNKLTKEQCENVLHYILEKTKTLNTKKSVTKNLVVEAMIDLKLKKQPSSIAQEPVQQLEAILSKFNTSENSLAALAETLKSQFKKSVIRKLIKALKDAS